MEIVQIWIYFFLKFVLNKIEPNIHHWIQWYLKKMKFTLEKNETNYNVKKMPKDTMITQHKQHRYQDLWWCRFLIQTKYSNHIQNIHKCKFTKNLPTKKNWKTHQTKNLQKKSNLQSWIFTQQQLHRTFRVPDPRFRKI